MLAWPSWGLRGLGGGGSFVRSSDGVLLLAGSGTANEPQGSKDRYDAPGPGPGLLRSRGTSGLCFPPPPLAPPRPPQSPL